MCKYLSFDSTVSDYQLLQGVAQAAKVYYNYTGSSPCLNTSQTATSSLGYLGWFYQVHKTALDSVMLCWINLCTRVWVGSFSCHNEYVFNPLSPGLHGDGDAHVHRWRAGHVWTRGVELPGLLWWVQSHVWYQATGWLGRHCLRGERDLLSQQHHLQVNIAFKIPDLGISWDFGICLGMQK